MIGRLGDVAQGAPLPGALRRLVAHHVGHLGVGNHRGGHARVPLHREPFATLPFPVLFIVTVFFIVVILFIVTDGELGSSGHPA